MKLTLDANGVTATGGSPLLMHNEQLADPLADITRSIGKITAKRKKTEADHIEIARLEFLGGLYMDNDGPCIPAWNVLRCLQDGASRHRRGQDVLRGITPIDDTASLDYEGPRDPDVMWKEGGFSLRKSIGVRGNRTMRTRPMFIDWHFQLTIEVDATVWDEDTLSTCWHDAGIYCGIGDMRPIHGRFVGTLDQPAPPPSGAKGRRSK